MRLVILALIALALTAFSPKASAAPVSLPPAARGVDIDEHLASELPGDLHFTDDSGHDVALADYFDGKRPVVLSLVYFRCPALCGQVMSGLVGSFGKISYKLGKDYRALTISIDPRDTPEEAARKQATALAVLGRQDDRAIWPFLVSPEKSSRAVADGIGFQYVYDKASDQYAHPAVVVVLTPHGRISRYLYGVDYRPLDLEVALSEAAGNKIGGISERVVMTCFRWDPASRRYGFSIIAFLRIGAAVIGLTVAGLLVILWRASIKRDREEASAP